MKLKRGDKVWIFGRLATIVEVVGRDEVETGGRVRVRFRGSQDQISVEKEVLS